MCQTKSMSRVGTTKPSSILFVEARSMNLLLAMSMDCRRERGPTHAWYRTTARCKVVSSLAKKRKDVQPKAPICSMKDPWRGTASVKFSEKGSPVRYAESIRMRLQS